MATAERMSISHETGYIYPGTLDTARFGHKQAA